MLVLYPISTHSAVLYSDNFDSYAPYSFIDGQGAWINSGSPFEWIVVPPVSPFVGTSGNILVRGTPFDTSSLDDWATVRLHSPCGFGGLTVSFDYLLQQYGTPRIDISPDNSTWTDVTTVFNLLQNNGSSLNSHSVADLSSLVEPARIAEDLYIRFSVRNLTGSTAYNLFAIDNLQISIADVPPIITCPPDAVSNANSPAGAVVSFATPPASGCSAVSVTCQPPSASTFPIGTNLVT